MSWFTRAIRPPDDDVVPNPNDPATVPPATVGPNVATPGDPHGVLFEGPDTPSSPPPTIWPSAWSGWPAEWWTPNWNGHVQQLTDTAWMAIDLNASVLMSMPPYLVDPASSLVADWLNNPEPETYASFEEFMKALAWDYQLGEAFVLATARYATGWPARFHVVPPWMVKVELDNGRRIYEIGNEDVTGDMLHIRYSSTVDNPHGVGPLEVGALRMVAAQVLTRYGTTLAASGGIPSSILTHPEQLSAEQSAELQAQWVNARLSKIGEPAVLSGGITWEATQVNPRDMALIELLHFNESRIAYLLGVPAYLLGLPTPSSESLTYSNVQDIYDMHWRGYLRPKAQAMMSALSGWALPRGTRVEVNRDAYVQPGPLERAQTEQIYNAIRDEQGNPVLSVAEIRARERFTGTPETLMDGVLK